MVDASQRLIESLRDAGSKMILVVTGAGISQASGIPTFRGSDPDAIWKHSDVEMATRGFFERDPVTHWSWYLQRFAGLESARPNPAHHALADLERWQIDRGGSFLLVTQNIDCLHEMAGSNELIKVHGTSDRLRCSRMGCEHGAPLGSILRDEVDMSSFESSPETSHLPLCPACRSRLRVHVLLFDEFYGEHRDYEFARVEIAAREADVVLFIGTSFSVGVTDLVLWSAASRSVPTYSIDPAAPPSIAGNPAILVRARAETLLPAACVELGVPSSSTTGYTLKNE